MCAYIKKMLDCQLNDQAWKRVNEDFMKWG